MPYGVLGTQESKDTSIHQIGTLPNNNIVLCDPAGVEYIQNGPNGAGAASKAIYRFLGIYENNTQFPDEVKTKVTTVCNACYYPYAKAHVIHVVGPNFDTLPYSNLNRDAAEKILASAYNAVFTQFLRHDCTPYTLRLLPISGGIFAGNFRSIVADLSFAAIEKALKMLIPTLTPEKLHNLKICIVEYCIYKENELQCYKDAYDQFVQRGGLNIA
jgi:hypothetical protein